MIYKTISRERPIAPINAKRIGLVDGTACGMRPDRAWIMLVAVLAAAMSWSCASKRAATAEHTTEQARWNSAWLGRTQLELEAAWGRPTARTPDGSGGSILVYERPRTWQASTGEAFGAPPGQSSVIQDDSFNRETVARFRVDQAGIIVEVWIHPKLWKKGFPLPPPPK